jgi:RNA polymerase sigma-70 factor (TIGR02943 family)
MTAGQPAMRSDPATWVDAHGAALLAYAVPRVRDQQTAEDLVQETFLAALKAGNFRGDAQERTWLVSILRNKICDHFRRLARERTHAGGDGNDPVEDAWYGTHLGMMERWTSPPKAWLVDEDVLMERREFWQAFHECLRGLPSRQAAAFVLRLMEDVEAEQVCQDLDITETNLWVMLHRARARLRTCLEERWFTP